MNVPFVIDLDPRTAFPMYRLQDFDFSVMWLPMTKIQVEYFLSETDDSRFDARWYQSCLVTNPRRSPYAMTTSDYWNVFMTGITFDEVQILRQWWRGFDLPTKAEWNALLNALDQHPAHPDYVQVVRQHPGLHERAGTLIERLEQLHQSQTNRTLAHQTLLRNGIEEYVYLDSGRHACGVEGYPPRQLNGGRRTELRNVHQGLAAQGIGFRLIVRG